MYKVDHEFRKVPEEGASGAYGNSRTNVKEGEANLAGTRGYSSSRKSLCLRLKKQHKPKKIGKAMQRRLRTHKRKKRGFETRNLEMVYELKNTRGKKTFQKEL